LCIASLTCVVDYYTSPTLSCDMMQQDRKIGLWVLIWRPPFASLESGEEGEVEGDNMGTQKEVTAVPHKGELILEW